jgi:dipeptidyl aminopeptidase/acylaminoacyl peptidase
MLFAGVWPRTEARVLTKDWDADFGSDDISSDQHPPRGGGAKPLAFSADGRYVYGVACRHGAAMLARVDTKSGALETLTPEDRDLVCGSATPDAKRFALTIGGLARPGDLYLYDVARRELRLLCAPNEALFAERPLGEIEPFWCDAFDGQKLHGWIVKPPDFDPQQRYPMVLQIHGGPHVAYGFGFFHEFRVLAAAGYVVLYMNPRGSTTYGQEFGNVIQYRYPGDDYRDLLSAVDHVIARGYVDDKRLGVTGGSGGGLLTNWVVTHTDRFAAAITQRCVSEWASMWYSSDFSMFLPYWFRKHPYEDAAEYQGRSPVHLVDKITTPLMVIHSEEDWRTPIGQGEAMFRALIALRKATVMVRFPGENHELSRSGTPSRRVQNQEHIRRWFDRWLMGKDAPEYGV